MFVRLRVLAKGTKLSFSFSHIQIDAPNDELECMYYIEMTRQFEVFLSVPDMSDAQSPDRFRQAPVFHASTCSNPDLKST